MEQDKDGPCFSAIVLRETLTLGYTCENCSLDFYSIKHLKQHRLSSIHSDKFFYCVICRHEFTTLRHMRSHATNHKEFEEWQEAFPITRYFVCNIGVSNKKNKTKKKDTTTRTEYNNIYFVENIAM